MILQNKYFNSSILVFIFILGCIVAFTRGSNFSDGDAYSVIVAYLNFFNEGIYTPSRGAYGHPIPELLIGFFSYYFGTPFSNVLCFNLFFFHYFFFIKHFVILKKILPFLFSLYYLILTFFLKIQTLLTIL